MQDFNSLTDTGKLKAYQDAEKKWRLVQRLALGVVRVLFRENYDMVTDAIERWKERDKETEIMVK